MRKLTDSEVLSRAESLKKRHRSEWCRLVYEATVNRSMQQLADLLGYSRKWVADHLKRYAIESASGGGSDRNPLVSAGAQGDTKAQVDHVVKEYAPPEPDEEYIAEYEAEGHTSEVAKCLATAYEAGKNAIDAGVIKETWTWMVGEAIPMPVVVSWSITLESCRRRCGALPHASGNAHVVLA